MTTQGVMHQGGSCDKLTAGEGASLKKKRSSMDEDSVRCALRVEGSIQVASYVIALVVAIGYLTMQGMVVMRSNELN
jgi:hypothetical protein